VFLAPFKGCTDEEAAMIIFFIFFAAGAFAVVNRTGAITAGLQRVIRFSFKYPKYKLLILGFLIFMFSFCGATWGMAEETLIFLIPIIPLVYALGFDAFVAIGITYMAANMGFASAMLNPFTVGVAQGIAQVPLFSGWEFRLIPFAAYTLISFIFVAIYARRIEKDPSKSPLLCGNQSLPVLETQAEEILLTTGRKLVLLVFVAALGLLVFGVTQWGWYISEIAGLFFGLAVVSALVCRIRLADAFEAFIGGAKDMIMVAFIIGLSRSIQITAENGKIMDTLLYWISSLAGDLPAIISIQVMFFVQGAINFFIPSGSGQAVVTMPIMAPLADLIGVSRQSAVLAYQLGDGLFNMIIPTNFILMGVLSLTKISFKAWLRWVGPLILILTIASMVLLGISTQIQW
jgi:uncharacterized ion transporter superfamily protein YfcC